MILTDVATTPANDSDPREISDNTTRTGSILLGTATAIINNDVATDAPAATLATKIDVTLQNAWAVRSLSSANGVELALTNTNNTLTSVIDKTSSISTSGATLSSGSLTGDKITIPSGWAPVKGDIKFQLDLSGANSSGEYNTRATAGPAGDTAVDNATDTFLLTLTGL